MPAALLETKLMRQLSPACATAGPLLDGLGSLGPNNGTHRWNPLLVRQWPVGVPAAAAGNRQARPQHYYTLPDLHKQPLETQETLPSLPLPPSTRRLGPWALAES